jgi:S-adenosylmethionine:tRNA ribosyltransferase-isomerase
LLPVSLSTDLFDFHLPERLIAQKPADRRDASRLLVVHRAERRWEHRTFRDLPEYLRTGDTLFRNNAAVLPARLQAQRPTGGAVECFLLRAAADADNTWWCLVRPGRKLPPGAVFSHGDAFRAEVLEKAPDGTARIRFVTADGGPIDTLAAAVGEVPLPPYIARAGTDEERRLDRERYQTVYADPARRVAVAAPTAGLHFTPELLEVLRGQGVAVADMTLHVGLGTFKPMSTAAVADHVIHRETYEMPPDAQRRLFDTPGRRIAVGTTSVRTIEAFLSSHDQPGDTTHRAEAALFIHPPYTFRGVDALVTNFHQPRSTLLCLVAAFLAPGSTEGISFLHAVYAEAIAREYRFFSYGDAMLVL